MFQTQIVLEMTHECMQFVHSADSCEEMEDRECDSTSDQMSLQGKRTTHTFPTLFCCTKIPSCCVVNIKRLLPRQIGL